MGLIAGTIVHLGETEQIPRFLMLGIVGIILYVGASYSQESLWKRDPVQQERVAKYVIYSLLLAVGIGMISGGTQHFLDFPVYASYLLPIGLVLALIAYILRNNLDLNLKSWALLMIQTLWVVIPVSWGLNLYAQSLSVQSDPPGHQHYGSHSSTDATHSNHQPAASMGSSTALESLTASLALTHLTNLAADQPVQIKWVVVDNSGAVIDDFQIFQEKLMHLIVVNQDLSHFQHVHPTYQGKGVFETELTFPDPGRYTLFSDYQPAQKSEVLSLTRLTIPGIPPVASPPDLKTTQKLGELTVDLLTTPQPLQSNQDTTLTFRLKEQDQPITNLRPYLGEKGHLVIIRKGAIISDADYIHAHAIKDESPNEVKFVTVFPEAGEYKLWGQFNRGGELLVADFWMSVQQSSLK
jgi:hypothetical protein